MGKEEIFLFIERLIDNQIDYSVCLFVKRVVFKFFDKLELRNGPNLLEALINTLKNKSLNPSKA